MDEHLTRSQKVIKDLLADGRPRSLDEIRTHLDPYAETTALQVLIHRVRKVISKYSLSILAERNGDGITRYRMVRYISAE